MKEDDKIEKLISEKDNETSEENDNIKTDSDNKINKLELLEDKIENKSEEENEDNIKRN